MMNSKPMNQMGPPPPAYYQQQQDNLPGQTYYQPPPPQNSNYQPPPPPSQPNHHQQQDLRTRVNNFYNPSNPNKPHLGKVRKFTSGFCCFMLIALIVGLAAGFATRHNRHSSAYCRVNSDCYYRYGSGVYCYNGYCSR
ncbi:unnamed protein product [Cunninghamella echinulata]